MVNNQELPRIVFMQSGLQILKHSLALFAEALGRNSRALPNMHLATLSLASLQRKVDDLFCKPSSIGAFDYNEAIILVAALNIFQVNIVFFPQTESTEAILKNCTEMIAYFTNLQAAKKK